MTKFQKNIKITVQTRAQLDIDGNIVDVINTLHNLSYIFGNRPISSISQKEFTEAFDAIEVIKTIKEKSESRRRQ